MDPILNQMYFYGRQAEGVLRRDRKDRKEEEAMEQCRQRLEYHGHSQGKPAVTGN